VSCSVWGLLHDTIELTIKVKQATLKMKWLNRLLIYICCFLLCGYSIEAISKLEVLNPIVKDLKQLQRDGTRLSLVLQPLKGIEPLISFGADSIIPSASLAKLFTTYAALNILGPGFRFKTTAFINTKYLKGGVLDFPLIIKGYGDPFMVSERLWKFAEKIKGHGIVSLPKGIEIDQSYFSDYPNFVMKSKLNGKGSIEPYLAPLAPTSLNFNTITLGFYPDLEKLNSVRPSVIPDSVFYQVTGGVKKSHRKHLWHIERKHLKGKVEFHLDGHIKSKKDMFGYQSITQPTSYFGFTLLQMLKGMGVHSLEQVNEKKSREQVELQGFYTIDFDSHPLSDLVKSINTYSNNFMADMLVYALGTDPGSTQASYERGRKKILAWLKAQGMEIESTHFKVGSGLSQQNQVKGTTLIKLLNHAWKNTRVGPEFFASFSSPGGAGTLKEHDQLPEIRAKTGSLAHVSNLVGLMQGASGEPYFVVYLSSNPKRNLAQLMEKRDKLLLKLAKKL
jgi:serine-type D-Ala-D-Ala carboxypeptidase/endopeptidase (penicillin-binding protein 4)